MHSEHLFDIMLSGTFNKLGGAKLQKEGRWYDEQERFFNLRFSNYYLPFTIIVIRSFNIKEIHLTQQWFRWKPFIWLHSTCDYWMFRFYFMQVSLTYSWYHKNDFLTSRYLLLLEKFGEQSIWCDKRAYFEYLYLKTTNKYQFYNIYATLLYFIKHFYKKRGNLFIF